MADFGSIAPGPPIDWRELMLRLAAANQLPGAAMPQPEGDGGLSLPLNVQGFVNAEGAGRPRVGASIGIPAFGGELGLKGDFSRPDRLAPTDWSAILNYKRRF